MILLPQFGEINIIYFAYAYTDRSPKTQDRCDALDCNWILTNTNKDSAMRFAFHWSTLMHDMEHINTLHNCINNIVEKPKEHAKLRMNRQTTDNWLVVLLQLLQHKYRPTSTSTM